MRKKTKQRKISRTKKRRVTKRIPKHFNLESNIEGVLNFIQECKDLRRTSTDDVFFDFTHAVELSQGAMALLLSTIHDLNLYNVIAGGNVPTNEQALAVFKSCGFLKFFKSSLSVTKAKNTILVQGSGFVNPIESAAVIEEAMETVFSKKMRNQKLQGIIIEMMANSVNHAFHDEIKNTKWYLSTFHHEEKNLVKFCFVDNGKGILKTIEKKFFSKVSDLFDSKDVIRKAYKGEYGSRTGRAERGTGLIAISDSFSEEVIKNLKVITNDLFYDFSTNSVTQLKHKFNGTFYFWELDLNCKHVIN